MKKGLKVLATLGVAALSTAVVTSCGEKPAPTDTSKESQSSEVESQSSGKESESKESQTSEVESQSSESQSSESQSESSESESEQTDYQLDLSQFTTEYVKGSKLSFEKLIVKDKDGNVLTEGTEDNQYVIDYTNLNLDEDMVLKTTGEFTINVVVTPAGKDPVVLELKISVVNEIVREIATVQDFLAMRHEVSSQEADTKFNDYSYKLTADIDLEGVELDQCDVIFRGVIDGQGHTIKNASYVAKSSKEALMFKEIAGTSTIKNLHFFNCSAVNASETIAIVAGEIHQAGTNVITFEDVEFSMCTVKSDNNYAALVIGRVEGTTADIIMDKITVKNFTSVTCVQYGGGLLGDVIAKCSMKVTNSDIDLDSSTNGNGSQIIGRNRGVKALEVENVIFRGDIDAVTTSNKSTAYVTGGNKATGKLVIKNVLVLGKTTQVGDLLLSSSDTTPAANKTIENIYYVEPASVDYSKIAGNYTKITKDQFTASWATSTLKLPADIFEADSNTVVHIKGSSSNTPAETATVKSIVLSTDSVKKQFFVTDKFDTEGLATAIVWSDGCTTSADSTTVVVKNAEGTVVDSTDLSKLATGDYSVEVTVDLGAKGKATSSYNIAIVKYTDTVVITDDAKTVFAVGQKFDATNLYVFAQLSDGTQRLDTKAAIKITDKDGNAVDATKEFTQAGQYTVTVTLNGFAKTYTIDVVEPQQAVGTVNVVVDALAVNGTKVDGCYEFNTIEKAINYLDSLALDEDAVKTIYVKNGTYKEKVYVSVPNVSIIGETKEKTIITFDYAEGTPKLNGDGTYKMDCATFTVNASATGFTMSNITVRNDFDYAGSKLADKQAFALRCDADKATFNNVYFYGVQDTLYANKGRQYYYNCRIDGAVDYVFGEADGGVALFDTCVFHSVVRKNNQGAAEPNNGYVFAPKTDATEAKGVKYNYVVMNSVFEADAEVLDGAMSVARPWGASANLTILNSTFTKAYSVLGYGEGKSRYADMSGNSPENAQFAEYKTTQEGQPVVAAKGFKVLTDEEAKAYTIANIFAKENGKIVYADAWAPVTETSKNPAQNGELSYVSYYELGKEQYKEGETFVPSVVKAYKVTYESTAYGRTIVEEITPTEVIKDSTGKTVDAATMLSAAGQYTLTLVYDEVEIDSKQVTVVSASQSTVEFTYTEPENVSDWEVNIAAAGSTKTNGVIGDDQNDKTVTRNIDCDKLVANGTDNLTSKKFDACKKATLVVQSFTSGTNNSLKFVVEALDASGNVVKSVQFAGPTKKLFVETTVDVESTTDFVQLRIRLDQTDSNTNTKNACIYQIKTTLVY